MTTSDTTNKVVKSKKVNWCTLYLTYFHTNGQKRASGQKCRNHLLLQISRTRCTVCPQIRTASVIHMHEGGRSVPVSTTVKQQYTHAAHCCNEGAMFLPLIYPDYTMVCESLFHGAIHLSICFSSADCHTVSYTGRTLSPNSSFATWQHAGI